MKLLDLKPIFGEFAKEKKCKVQYLESNGNVAEVLFNGTGSQLLNIVQYIDAALNAVYTKELQSPLMGYEMPIAIENLVTNKNALVKQFAFSGEAPPSLFGLIGFDRR